MTSIGNVARKVLLASMTGQGAVAAFTTHFRQTRSTQDKGREKRMNIIKVGAVVSALGILGGCTTTQNGEWAPSTDTCAAIGAVAGA